MLLRCAPCPTPTSFRAENASGPRRSPTTAAPAPGRGALADIRRIGYEQIAAGGPTALSLNGIAKAMGMSGPALYRYFSTRDELLITLVTESFEALAASPTA